MTVGGDAPVVVQSMTNTDTADVLRTAIQCAELARAGALLDASGLKPSSAGWRIRYEGDKRTVIDGPFAETKELIAGYTLIEARSRDEALEWSRRFPNPNGAGVPAEIEVRPLYGLEDFAPSPAIERFKALDLPS